MTDPVYDYRMYEDDHDMWEVFKTDEDGEDLVGYVVTETTAKRLVDGCNPDHPQWNEEKNLEIVQEMADTYDRAELAEDGLKVMANALNTVLDSLAHFMNCAANNGEHPDEDQLEDYDKGFQALRNYLERTGELIK